ncbi:hypothetical protein WMY93_031598 [Mugilogobius chulae]|uniref:Hedgehog protein n=1 Tax=Mugilogobius chulae TaxID=88201 RepID=A0AAW0MFJ1_9GOBI
MSPSERDKSKVKERQVQVKERQVQVKSKSKRDKFQVKERQVQVKERQRQVPSQRETSLSQRETSLIQRETSPSQRGTSPSQRETSPSQVASPRKTNPSQVSSQRETSPSQVPSPTETSPSQVSSQKETSPSQRETSLSQRETSPESKRDKSKSKRDKSESKRDKSKSRKTSLNQRETSPSQKKSRPKSKRDKSKSKRDKSKSKRDKCNSELFAACYVTHASPRARTCSSCVRKSKDRRAPVRMSVSLSRHVSTRRGQVHEARSVLTLQSGRICPHSRRTQTHGRKGARGRFFEPRAKVNASASIYASRSGHTRARTGMDSARIKLGDGSQSPDARLYQSIGASLETLALVFSVLFLSLSAQMRRCRTSRLVWCVTWCVLLLSPLAHGCGPGRGYGKRRSARKLAPLAYKQFSPNVAEKTLGASGKYEGKITRSSERFKELTPNYNPDIIFKDEENTGADRMMTQVRRYWFDHSVAAKSGGCFPGDAQVTTETGLPKPLRNLRPGDRVLVPSRNQDGRLEFSEVLTFLDKDPEVFSDFYSLGTKSGATLKLTAAHLVFVAAGNCTEGAESAVGGLRTAFASEVRIGQCVLVQEELKKTLLSRVVSVGLVRRKGLYAPLTERGTLIVDNMAASCYAAVNQHKLAHRAFGPLRFLHRFVGNVAQNDRGVHWYARIIYWLGNMLMEPSDFHPTGVNEEETW